MKRTPRKFYLSALIILAILASSANAASYYVAQDGSGSNGLSWTTAYTNLQNAIDAAATTGDQIWVKADTYTVSTVIDLNKAVDIYCGFAGTESALNERPEIIDATIISGGNTTQCFNITADASINGLTITNANAANGGGMYISNCSPTIRNCVFTSNVASISGGAIYNDQSGATIVNCLFTNNTANTSSGGAVATKGVNSSVNLTNCTFVDNTATALAGGALYNTTTNLVITNCILWGNNSPVNPTYSEVHNDSTSAPTFNNCLIGQSNFESLNGSNNISQDPKFAGSSDYHLTDLSPCIDAGSNSAINGFNDDIEGSTRIKNSTVDIGAYEFYGDPTGSWSGSINGDPETLTHIINGTDTASIDWSINTSEGTITLSDTGSYVQDNDTVTITASGTATRNGVETSGYTITITGVIEVNTFSGDYTIEYDDPSWTDDSGTWTADRDIEVSDHVDAMAIEQTLVYTDPTDPSATEYNWNLVIMTDSLVDLIEVYTPGEIFFEITKSASYSDPNENIRTRYVYDSESSSYIWHYSAVVTDQASLDDYGDGEYWITIKYQGGTEDYTSIYFDRAYGDPIPQPQQRPILTSPQHQDGNVTSPTTLTWDICTDVNANSIWVSIEKANLELYEDSFDITATEWDTQLDDITLSDGFWNASIYFEYYQAETNFEGIETWTLKSSLAEYKFAVGKPWAAYEVYGSSNPPVGMTEDQTYDYYMNIDQQSEFEYLGSSYDGGTKNFTGNCSYYVIASRQPILIDSLMTASGQFYSGNIVSANIEDANNLTGSSDARYSIMGPKSSGQSFDGFVLLQYQLEIESLTVFTDNTTIPDFVGQSFIDVIKELSAININIGTVSVEFHSDIVGGTVLSQTETTGTGITLDLVVCAKSLQQIDIPFADSTESALADSHSNCGDGDIYAAWFEFTPSTTEMHTVIADGSAAYFDTTLSVYDGITGDIITCTDIYDGSNPESSMINMTAGHLYFIRVAGYGGEKGPFTIEVERTADNLIPGDICSSPIVMDTSSYSGTTVGATGTTPSNCSSADTLDVWHSFTPQENILATIGLCDSNFDTTIAIYDRCEGIELSCNDNGCGLQSLIAKSMTGGHEYLIRVAGYNQSSGDYTLTIETDTLNWKPDLNQNDLVDSADLMMMASGWLDISTIANIHKDGSNTINLSDLSLLAEYWLQ